MAINHKKRDKIVKEAFKYTHALQAYAYSMLRDSSLAEDVVQNAFIIVMDKYEKWKPGTSIFAWCRAIVRLKVLEMLRSRKKLTTVEDRILQDAVENAFTEHQDEEHASRMKDLKALLHDCMEKLPEQPRKLLKNLYIHRKSYQQMAREFGLKLETIRKSLYRARKNMQKCVELSSTRGTT